MFYYYKLLAFKIFIIEYKLKSYLYFNIIFTHFKFTYLFQYLI